MSHECTSCGQKVSDSEPLDRRPHAARGEGRPHAAEGRPRPAEGGPRRVKRPTVKKYYWDELIDDFGHKVSADEYQKLEKFLARQKKLGGCNSLAMADGFLTAIVGGPMFVPRKASDDFHLVWGGQPELVEGKPIWTKLQLEMSNILSRRAGMIGFGLDIATMNYQPLVGPEWRESIGLTSNSRITEPDVVAWCQGFVKGLKFCFSSWAPMMKSNTLQPLLAQLLFLGTGDGWKKLDNFQIAELAKYLTFYVMQMSYFFELPAHAYWIDVENPDDLFDQFKHDAVDCNHLPS